MGLHLFLSDAIGIGTICSSGYISAIDRCQSWNLPCRFLGDSLAPRFYLSWSASPLSSSLFRYSPPPHPNLLAHAPIFTGPQSTHEIASILPVTGRSVCSPQKPPCYPVFLGLWPVTFSFFILQVVSTYDRIHIMFIFLSMGSSTRMIFSSSIILPSNFRLSLF